MAPAAPGMLLDAVARLAELHKHLPPYWIPAEAGGIKLALLASLRKEVDEQVFEEANKEYADGFAARVPEVAALPPAHRWYVLERMVSNYLKAFLLHG